MVHAAAFFDNDAEAIADAKGGAIRADLWLPYSAGALVRPMLASPETFTPGEGRSGAPSAPQAVRVSRVRIKSGFMVVLQ
jgi:hypothetical protein